MEKSFIVMDSLKLAVIDLFSNVHKCFFEKYVFGTLSIFSFSFLNLYHTIRDNQWSCLIRGMRPSLYCRSW